MSIVKTLTYAPDAWKFLNGFICIYKPAGLSSLQVRRTLVHNLCRDLNEMDVRKPRDRVLLEGSITSGNAFEVKLVPNFADNTLVSGPRYQIQDVRMKWLYRLGRNTSGVLLMAVNDGCKVLKDHSLCNYLRKYELKGKFGPATRTFMADGIVAVRSTYSHIRQASLDHLLASIQASHQALAYQYSGVNIESQEAYELASKGIVRPYGKSEPIIYGIKCSNFSLPDFTLEIQCINETEEFLAQLAHEIGIYLRSNAVCTQLRQVQYGPFILDYALLRKHWTLENILSNMTLCKAVLNQGQLMPNSAHFECLEVSKLKEVLDNMQKEMNEDHL